VTTETIAALKLNLGSGKTKMDGFVGVDSYADSGADIICDLTVYPWPWPDNSVDEVHASHFLEHLSGLERIPFFNELWRIMKPGATATFVTPHWASIRAIQDPTHKWPPVCESFYMYLNAAWRESQELEHYLGLTCDFEPAAPGYNVGPPWAQRSVEARDFALAYHINVAADLHQVLTKKG